LPVVFDQSVGLGIIRRIHDLARYLWFHAPDAGHHAIHVREFFQCGPVPVLRAPIGAWRQPHREGFRKILVRMRLGVVLRLTLTLDIIAAEWIELELEICRITFVERAKNSLPFSGAE